MEAARLGIRLKELVIKTKIMEVRVKSCVIDVAIPIWWFTSVKVLLQFVIIGLTYFIG